MVPDQIGRTRLHGGQIEPVEHLPDQTAVMNHRRPAADQPEGVAPLDCRKAGMEVVGNPSHLHHCNRRGLEVEVQRLCQAEGIPVPLQITMGHLPCCVHARIGSARCGNGMRPGFQPRERSLYRALHGFLTLRLALPASKGATIIFDFQRVSWHETEVTQRNLRVHSPHTRWVQGADCRDLTGIGPDHPDAGTANIRLWKDLTAHAELCRNSDSGVSPPNR